MGFLQIQATSCSHLSTFCTCCDLHPISLIILLCNAGEISAVEALRQACQSLKQVCEHMKATFQEEYQEHMQQAGGTDTSMADREASGT